MWKYLQLSETLSGLYFRTKEITELIIRAGLPPARFELDGAANVVWTLTIKTLENMNKIPQLVDAALTDYPDNPVLMDYKNNKATITNSVYSGDKADWKGSPNKPELEKITGSQSTLLPISFFNRLSSFGTI